MVLMLSKRLEDCTGNTVGPGKENEVGGKGAGHNFSKNEVTQERNIN